MEGGISMLNCLLQHTLRSLCSSDYSPDSSKWVYSVFWRILPRNYPPPKWDFGGGAIDRAKGNKRNWILVWEDGYCDFYECERAGCGYVKGRFGPEVFFKMSHEVYSYGEGLVGKVAADNSHKWVFRDSQNEPEANFMSSWNMSIEPQPKAWDTQFNSGIQTIAIIAVREGIVQLGSLDKVVEDTNLVINIQRKFSYLQSIPGVFSIQRPFPPHLPGAKRPFEEGQDELDGSPIKSVNMGWNGPHHAILGAPPAWPIPSLLPSMSCGLGSVLAKMPLWIPAPDNPNIVGDIRVSDVKMEPSYDLDMISEEKPRPNKENNQNLAD